ncbi:hypothetical protein [Burkholderia multivorans]|uniref:hypothetical protein n=1 Tax=Burkholderia multivorans TaxID=87883 RepID=UPI0012FD13F8|nr:hypothetical protein [Burkholderia multivorans]MBU9472076.1 hypothetical protein [Burkholderia multivorans]
MTTEIFTNRKLPEIKVPLFGGTVILCRTQIELQDLLQYNGYNRASDHVGGSCITIHCEVSKARYYIVSVFNDSIGTLSHELSHATFHILSDVGVTVKGDDSNETFCYMMGHLMFHALTKLKAETHFPETKALQSGK